MTSAGKPRRPAAFLVGFALALALGLAILATLVWCLGTHDGLMARWMLQTAPPEETGLPAEAYGPLCTMLCRYLRGSLSAFDFSLGGVSLFGTREVLHLADCVTLFRLAKELMLWGWIASAALAVLLLILRGRPCGAKGLLAGTLLLLAGVVGLAVWGAVDFRGLFTAFHRLAFTNDLWIMNPATDLIIRLMPTVFFVRYALAIGGGWLLAEVILVLAARRAIRREGSL